MKSKFNTPLRGKGSRGRTNNRRVKNSESWDESQELNERFHGRPTREILTLLEKYKYHSNGPALAELIELVLVTNPDKRIGIPIRFGTIKDDNSTDETRPILTSDPTGHQLYFVGGDTSLDLDDLNLDDEEKLKQYILLGNCYSITYWTDKHHLEGPKYQAKGTAYEHEFGEEGGEEPTIVYDTLNKNILLVGGTYHISDEGIIN
jgi:hypothetical protein